MAVAVVEHTSGSPGRAGWVMAVGRDGWLAGTVGGGTAEEAALLRAAAMLDDDAAVAALAGTPLGYLDVLGTPSKLAHLPGRPELEVPTGMPIGSHTPDEIAVSVAARLVAVRSEAMARLPRVTG